MNAAICTKREGVLIRTKPARSECAVVDPARIIEQKTPRVAFVMRLRPAMLPSRDRLNGPISKLSPPAVNGMRSAKMINGNSIVARFARVSTGNLEMPITRKIMRKYPMNDCHCCIGVRTAITIKEKNATSLMCPGSSWIGEWRCM